MFNAKAIRIVAMSACLCSCTSTADVDSLQWQINSLKESVVRVEEAVTRIAAYQQTLDKQMNSLYIESERAIAGLQESVETLKGATDGLEFIPGEYGRAIVSSTSGAVVMSLSRTSFWENSGGRNPFAPGNHSYNLYVDEAGLATINLFSSNEPAIDTYLYLLSDRGRVIAQDNDGGDQQYSRITTELDVGSYTVVAATYSEGINASYVVKVEGVEGRLESLPNL